MENSTMEGILKIETIEQLQAFLNNDNIMEIVIRGRNSKFKAFQKVVLNGLEQSEAKKTAEKIINIVAQNNNLLQGNLQLIQSVAKSQNLGLILNGLTLATTAAGFAIMYEKLDKLSFDITNQLNQLQDTMKQGNNVNTNFEFGKVLSEYTDMLDCRKRQKPYSEDKMRVLVDNMYNVLNLLYDSLKKDIVTDKQETIFSIFSLLSMFTTSIKYFDELYYLNNREILSDGDAWHSSHSKWMSIYSKLSMPDFIQRLQDHAFFEVGFNTLEVDIYCQELFNQVNCQKQEIEDNQELIMAIKDGAILNNLREFNINELKQDLENALEEAFEDRQTEETSRVYNEIHKQIELL